MTTPKQRTLVTYCAWGDIDEWFDQEDMDADDLHGLAYDLDHFGQETLEEALALTEENSYDDDLGEGLNDPIRVIVTVTVEPAGSS